MAPRSTSKRKAGGKAKSRVSGGQQALDRLNESIDAAEKALKDLRAEMSRGSRTILKDVDTTLRDARKHARSIRKEVAKELEDLQRAATGRVASARSTATARKPAAKKATARKAAAPKATARKTTARKKTAAGKAAAPKATARKTTARKTTARASTTSRKKAAR